MPVNQLRRILILDIAPNLIALFGKNGSRVRLLVRHLDSYSEASPGTARSLIGQNPIQHPAAAE